MTRKKRNKSSSSVVPEAELLRYLQGEMSAQDQYAFELEMEEHPFLRDAVEGLEAMEGKQIPDVILQLNTQLKKQVKQKKNAPLLFFNQKLLIWVAVILLILLAFISWWLIHIVVNK